MTNLKPCQLADILQQHIDASRSCDPFTKPKGLKLEHLQQMADTLRTPDPQVLVEALEGVKESCEFVLRVGDDLGRKNVLIRLQKEVSEALAQYNGKQKEGV